MLCSRIAAYLPRANSAEPFYAVSPNEDGAYYFATTKAGNAWIRKHGGHRLASEQITPEIRRGAKLSLCLA